MASIAPLAQLRHPCNRATRATAPPTQLRHHATALREVPRRKAFGHVRLRLNIPTMISLQRAEQLENNQLILPARCMNENLDGNVPIIKSKLVHYSRSPDHLIAFFQLS